METYEMTSISYISIHVISTIGNITNSHNGPLSS